MCTARYISLLLPTNLDLRQPSSELDGGKNPGGGEMKKKNKNKNVPFRCFPELKNSFGQMEASAEQEEAGNVRQKIFCALKTAELPSEAVLQRTDFILV